MVTCCTSSPDDRNNDGDLADTWAAVPEAVPQVLRVLLTSGASWAHEALWKVHPGPQCTDAGEHLCSSVNLWIMALVFLSHSVLMPRSTAGILKADTPSTSCMYNITDTITDTLVVTVDESISRQARSAQMFEHSPDLHSSVRRVYMGLTAKLCKWSERVFLNIKPVCKM